MIVFSWRGEVDTTEIQGVFLILDDQKGIFCISDLTSKNILIS